MQYLEQLFEVEREGTVSARQSIRSDLLEGNDEFDDEGEHTKRFLVRMISAPPGNRLTPTSMHGEDDSLYCQTLISTQGSPSPSNSNKITLLIQRVQSLTSSASQTAQTSHKPFGSTSFSTNTLTLTKSSLVTTHLSPTIVRPRPLEMLNLSLTPGQIQKMPQKQLTLR